MTFWVGGPSGSQVFETSAALVVGLFRLSVGGGGALGSQSGKPSVGWNGSRLPVHPGGFAATGTAKRTVANATVSSENRIRRRWVGIRVESLNALSLGTWSTRWHHRRRHSRTPAGPRCLGPPRFLGAPQRFSDAPLPSIEARRDGPIPMGLDQVAVPSQPFRCPSPSSDEPALQWPVVITPRRWVPAGPCVRTLVVLHERTARSSPLAGRRGAPRRPSPPAGITNSLGELVANIPTGLARRATRLGERSLALRTG